MMHNPKADLGYMSKGQFGPVISETEPFTCRGSTVRRLQGLAEKSERPGQNDETTNAHHDRLTEDEILELAIQLLESTGIANNLPASMRVIEHIAESAGYSRARLSASTKVTELMLMAARASELADHFRQDP